MPSDLLDAEAAIEWGISELPLVAQRFHAWRQANTGLSYVQTEGGKKIAVFRKKGELPSIVNAGVGSIINSFRTSLDLLAAALAVRNGVAPSRATHFPIFSSFEAFSDPRQGMESKKWLSKSELSILKSLSPYNGGDPLIWALHQLDILRKHERLLFVLANPSRLLMVGTGERPKILFSRSQPLEDKTPLFELSADAPEPETDIEFDIFLEEPTLPGIHRQPLFVLLNEFRRTTTAIIDRFRM